ncbi:MAG: vitamin K epoxide reductase family protein, partial [Planctomycetota bacterium]
MIKAAWKLTIPLFVLSLCGAYISLLLLDKHLLKSHGPSWFAAVCGDETGAPEGEATTQPDAAAAAAEERRRHEAESADSGKRGGANCDRVLASRWATIPPRPDVDEELFPTTEPQKAQTRIPSAYLGFVYFTSLAIWFLFIGRPTPDRWEWYRIPLAFVICGVISSLFFIYIMFTQAEAWCPWCLVSHIINFLILIGMILLRPKEVPAAALVSVSAAEPAAVEVVAATPDAAGAQPTPSGELTWQALGELGVAEALAGAVSAPVRSHPAYRLVAATILLAATTCAMVWNGYAVQVEQERTKQTRAELNSFRADMSLLAAIYEQAPQVEIPIRPDDPQTVTPDIYCPLVLFSDFECPWCRTFAGMLRQRIAGYFTGGLRVTWKHFPLSQDCNGTISRTVHPEACRTALAAEAARMQGGNEAFWKAHDLLFAAQKKLKDFDYRALAVELGLDPDRFEADMKSEAAAARIAEDIT